MDQSAAQLALETSILNLSAHVRLAVVVRLQHDPAVYFPRVSLHTVANPQRDAVRGERSFQHRNKRRAKTDKRRRKSAKQIQNKASQRNLSHDSPRPSRFASSSKTRFDRRRCRNSTGRTLRWNPAPLSAYQSLSNVLINGRISQPATYRRPLIVTPGQNKQGSGCGLERAKSAEWKEKLCLNSQEGRKENINLKKEVK